MISEIVNVLSDIVKGMNQTTSPEDTLKYLNQDKKYNKNVIAAAYSWIYEKLTREIIDEVEGAISSGFRILSKKEQEEIGLENYNYLLHLINIGLLTNNDFNIILDQLKVFAYSEISIDKVNILILSLFLDMDNVALPGSRLLLYSSDTIN